MRPCRVLMLSSSMAIKLTPKIRVTYIEGLSTATKIWMLEFIIVYRLAYGIFFFLKLSLPEGKGLWTIYDHLWGSPLVFSVLGRKETGRMTLYETWLEFTHIPEKRLKMFHSFSDSFERMIIRMIRSGVVSNSGWWWLEHEFHDFPYLGNVIIPTDFHSIIFQRGRLKPPSRSIINHH